MDKLNTCMICRNEFKENENVVVVNDAKYLGFAWSDDMASFEQHEAPERGVYCNECYAKLVVYSWDLSKKTSERYLEENN